MVGLLVVCRVSWVGLNIFKTFLNIFGSSWLSCLFAVLAEKIETFLGVVGTVGCLQCQLGRFSS